MIIKLRNDFLEYEEDPFNIEALHEHTNHDRPDPDKVDRLAQDMEDRGWVGPGVIIVDRLAITGTHRIVAARDAGIEIAVLDLADTVDNLDEILFDIYQDYGLEWLDAAAMIASCLPDPWGPEVDLDHDSYWLDSGDIRIV